MTQFERWPAEPEGPYYAGVGSRETPFEIRVLMRRVGRVLALMGYTLRSGAADGADHAFERGCDDVAGKKAIYLAWKQQSGHPSPWHGVDDDAIVLARAWHPGFDRMSQGAQKLMARNGYQILGPNLNTPSTFAMCWTSDGCASQKERSSKTGGTGQAISLALHHQVPLYNLQRVEHRAVVEGKLSLWEDQWSHVLRDLPDPADLDLMRTWQERAAARSAVEPTPARTGGPRRAFGP